MPYTHPNPKTAAHMEGERRRSIARFRSLGLEPLDIDDPQGQLRCIDCGKVSGRYATKKYRHYEDCYRREVS